MTVLNYTINSVRFNNNIYSQTSMAGTSLGPWEFVRNMGSTSYWGLIMAPGQEAKGDNLGESFRSSKQKWYVECTDQNRLNEAILMSTYNKLFHNKIRKFPEILIILSFRKIFLRTQKRSN